MFHFRRAGDHGADLRLRQQPCLSQLVDLSASTVGPCRQVPKDIVVADPSCIVARNDLSRHGNPGVAAFPFRTCPLRTRPPTDDRERSRRDGLYNKARPPALRCGPANCIRTAARQTASSRAAPLGHWHAPTARKHKPTRRYNAPCLSGSGHQKRGVSPLSAWCHPNDGHNKGRCDPFAGGVNCPSTACIIW